MEAEEIADPTCEDFDIWDLKVDELVIAILWGNVIIIYCPIISYYY